MENHSKTSISEYKLKNIKKIINELHHKGFETFTTTTVFNIFYCSLGIYGKECKKLGIKLLESLVVWMKMYRKTSYRVVGDFSNMYHPLLIEHIVEWCKTLPDEVNEDEILKEFSIKFQEKYDELQDLEEEPESKSYLFYGIGIMMLIAYYYYR